MSTTKSPIISLSLLTLLGVIWGTGYSIARFATTNGVPPLGYSFWQSVGPALLLGLVVLLPKKHRPSSTSVPALRYYFICGLMGIAIPNTTMYFAAPHLPAGILAMVVNTVPIIAYPLALSAKLENFNWQRLCGVVLAFFGLMLIVVPSTSLPSADMVPWVLMTLITPLSFAICSIYVARHQPANMDPLASSAGMLVASSLLLIPLVLSTHNFYFLHWPFTKPDLIILLEILLSSAGYILFFQLIRIAGPVYYSLVDTVVVITGLIWSKIIFDEQLNFWTGTAVFLILIALTLVTRQQRLAAKTTSITHA